jgi:DnaJ-class molecular chaperone
MSTMIEDTREKPRCPCCGGAGMHNYKPYITSSPDDIDAECTTCSGSGETWFDAQPRSCSGYRSLHRRNH